MARVDEKFDDFWPAKFLASIAIISVSQDGDLGEVDESPWSRIVRPVAFLVRTADLALVEAGDIGSALHKVFEGVERSL